MVTKRVAAMWAERLGEIPASDEETERLLRAFRAQGILELPPAVAEDDRLRRFERYGQDLPRWRRAK